MSDKEHENGDRVKRIWSKEGTVVDYSLPHLEGGEEYLIRWDGLGDPEWMLPADLMIGAKPKVSADHKHYFDFETRERNHPYFICKCGEYLSWDDAQEKMNL